MVLKGRPPVSAVVITYNEEGNIQRCLESLHWVDEIVLVDSESKDKTVEIAREFTDRIFSRRWPGSFSSQRNFGMAQAKGDWVLILDADERVTPEAQKEISTWLKSLEAMSYAAAQVPRRNFFFGKWLRFGEAYPDLQWRLLKKGKVCYDEQTSDTALIDGPCKLLSEPFDHFTGDGIADRIRKSWRDADYKAKEMLVAKRNAHWSDILFRPVATFIKIYLIKQGFRDGMEGYLYSALASFYTFIRYVKLWVLARG